MQQIDQAQSQLFENQQNQFLAQYMQYESCPFCSRSFFRGKLAYHLKHCSNENPMTKSNKPSPRHFKNSLSAATSYERCSHCNSRIPSYLASKHAESCSRMSETKFKKKSDSKDSEVNAEETIFPKIRSNVLSQDHVKTSKRIIVRPSGSKTIKIRQQLRCLRIAQQVQKIQCEYCGRKFSEQAGLRHIPICSLLKMKQQKQIVFNRDAKGIPKKQKTRLQGFGKSYELTASKVLFSNSNPINSTLLQPEKSHQMNNQPHSLDPEPQIIQQQSMKHQVEQK